MNISNNKAKLYIGFISIVVVSLVVLMHEGIGLKEVFDSNFPNFNKYRLPFFSAFLNSMVCISLIYAFVSIKNKDIANHRKMMILACFFSTLFLLNYVFYHLISESTSYGGEGIMKSIYLFILLTHVVLAATSFPFILYTVFLGNSMQKESHRKLAKIVFPIWFYVAFSGVLVYILISPYYPV